MRSCTTSRTTCARAHARRPRPRRGCCRPRPIDGARVFSTLATADTIDIMIHTTVVPDVRLWHIARVRSTPWQWWHCSAHRELRTMPLLTSLAADQWHGPLPVLAQSQLGCGIDRCVRVCVCQCGACDAVAGCARAHVCMCVRARVCACVCVCVCLDDLRLISRACPPRSRCPMLLAGVHDHTQRAAAHEHVRGPPDGTRGRRTPSTAVTHDRRPRLYGM